TEPVVSGWKAFGAVSNSAVTVNVCGSPTRFVAAGGGTPSRNLTHVLVAALGTGEAGDPGKTVTGTLAPVPSSKHTVIAPGVAMTEPGSVDVTVTVHVPPVVPVKHVSLASLVGSVSPTESVVPSGTATKPAPRFCCTVSVKSCDAPARFVELGLINVR